MKVQHRNCMSPFGWRAQTLIDTLKLEAATQARKVFWFHFQGLPVTANNMFKYRGSKVLSDEVRDFRLIVAASMGNNRSSWRPIGVVAVVIALKSPRWVSKAMETRKIDADNRVKTLLDAIEHATGRPDQDNWEVHVFKVHSDSESTEVHLFDLGDTIDYASSH